jgi:hypothetical protein
VGGKPKDPAYFRKYRASHPEYAARDRARSRTRKTKRTRVDRTAEYAKRNAKRGSRAMGPLPVLFPHIVHGTRLSFWQDELKMDLEQERELALLEGRDPVEAVRAYRRRETNWFLITGPLLEPALKPSA